MRVHNLPSNQARYVVLFFCEWVSAIAERAGDRYVTEWTDKRREAVGLLRLGLYLGKSKRVSPLTRRERGLLFRCCGLRRFGTALRCALVCVTVLN